MAQAYNHTILPLAARRDKELQVRWGIEFFRHYFGREPEGMWLPETAVDPETLEVLVANGIRFTVLSPRQAGGFGCPARGARGLRKRLPWTRDGRTDAACPRAGEIALFFYDGEIAQQVAFERLLNSGEQFLQLDPFPVRTGQAWSPPGSCTWPPTAKRSATITVSGRWPWPISFTGSRTTGAARIINYGEYLDRFPPEKKERSQIRDKSSWSCAHGVERWRSDCGCRLGGSTRTAPALERGPKRDPEPR